MIFAQNWLESDRISLAADSFAKIDNSEKVILMHQRDSDWYQKLLKDFKEHHDGASDQRRRTSTIRSWTS